MKDIFKGLDKKIRNLNHRRIDFFRKVRWVFLNFILSPISLYSKNVNAEQSILILRLDDKLGDCVTSTGFLREIKKNNPRSKVVVLCGSNSFSIYADLKFVDQLIIVKKGLLAAFKVWWQLRNEHFKFIINTSHILNPQMMFLSSMIRAAKKVTFLNSSTRIFSEHIMYEPNVDPVSRRYDLTLQSFGYKNNNLKYEIVVKPSEKQQALELLSEFKKKNKKIVILNSFAGARLRNFSFQTTRNIIQKLLQGRDDLVVVSLANSGDQNILENWKSDYSNPNWIVFKQATDLMLNIALVEQSDLVITPDTAWVHIASALEKKLVSVYREDTTEKNSIIWAPFGTKAVQLYSEKDDVNKINSDIIVKKSLDLLFSS